MLPPRLLWEPATVDEVVGEFDDAGETRGDLKMLECLHPLNDFATSLVDACYAHGWDRMAQWVADVYLGMPSERGMMVVGIATGMVLAMFALIRQIPRQRVALPS